jgi:hypothetical protein
LWIFIATKSAAAAFFEQACKNKVFQDCVAALESCLLCMLCPLHDVEQELLLCWRVAPTKLATSYYYYYYCILIVSSTSGTPGGNSCYVQLSLFAAAERS